MSTKGVLILIFVVALVFRLVGIDHGFPFIFHPDEPTIERSALGVRFFANPGHFDWPHLYIYANYFGYMGFAAIREALTHTSYNQIIHTNLPIVFNDSLIFYLLTRIFTAFLGALTVVPIYLTGKRLFGETAGIFAALTFALLPFHIRQSHSPLPDVPMVFFFSMAVYFATNIFLDGELEDYILAGLFSGFAASTKYNGALVIVSILLAHVLYNKNPLKKFFNLLLAGFFSITGFIIGTPYAVLDYKTFLRTDGPAGALWQFTNVGSRGLIDRITNTINIILFKISDDVAYIVLIGFFIVLGYLLFKFFSRQYVKDAYFRSLGFLVFPALFFIFYIGGLEKSRSHYLLVVYPYLSVVFGYLIFKLSEFSEQKSGILTYLLIPIFLAPVFYFAVMTSYAFYNGDTRVDFYKWAKANFNSPFPVVYSDRSAEVVVNSFARNRYRAKNIELIAPEGYLYSQDESFPEEEVRTRARVVNLLYDSGDSVQNGPKIKFYSYSL